MDNVYIHRELERVINQAFAYFPVITITGPRQSGKTTLIRNCFAQLPYYSLENDNILDLALNDPIAFLTRDPRGMVLDEVQNAPRLLSYMQQLVDDNPSLRFILSGSSLFAVLKDVSQSLAGRAAVYELLPFSLAEAAEAAPRLNAEQTILRGFYPGVVTGRNTPQLAYPAYLRTYAEKDIARLLNIGNQREFRTFLRLCAGRIGALFNASELANDVGVTSKTIASWLSVLQASYIIFLLQPYYANIGKRLTKTPKIYFVDTGLAASLLGLTEPEQLAAGVMRGPLFENLVVAEAYKRQLNRGQDPNIYFYRDAKGNEVDLILEHPAGLTAVEIKSAMTYNSDFERTLKQLPGWLNAPVRRSAVVYNGTYENDKSSIQLLNALNCARLFDEG